MTRVSRWWLLKLAEDVPQDATLRAEVWDKIHQVDGVEDITDMAVVSFATLEELLAPTDPEIVQLWRRQRRAERAAQHTPSA